MLSTAKISSCAIIKQVSERSETPKRTLRTIGSIAKSKAQDKETRMRAAYLDLLEQGELVFNRSEQTIRIINTQHSAMLGTLNHLNKDISELQLTLVE